MFNTVFSFEIKQQLKKPFTWVFLLLMISQGVYYMHHSGEFYSADKTYSNAPAILYTVLAGMGYIGFIVTAILGGSALGKDIDNRTSAILYTTRSGERSFFWARYAGSFTVLLLLYAGYLLGIILYNYLPAPNLGPFSWISLGRAALLIFLPNVFVLFSLCVAVSVLAKSSKSAYGVALAGMLLMIFAETSFSSSPNVVLADPTAFSVLHNQLEHLSPLEKNTFTPPFSGLLLYNRLIWVGIGLLLLLMASRRFSFTWFSQAGSKSKKRVEEKDGPAVLSVNSNTGIIKSGHSFSLKAYWKKVSSLCWLEFKSVTRPVGFRLFLSLILIIYICYIAVWQQQYYSAAPTLPVTLEITGVVLPLSFYFLLFLIINTTELLFRNSSSGFWQISDALPVPTWVTVLSKIIAMLGVALVMTFCLMLFGMLVQAAKGYYHFETGIYFRELFIRWMPKYLLYILLTVFVAGLTANRYATHWITILFLIFSVILHETEAIEQHRFNYMFSPGSGLATDMNGSSIFGAAHGWFMLYWFSLAIALLSVALWVWQRGTPVSLAKRMNKRMTLNPVLVTLFIAGVVGFICCEKKIYQTINVENKFQTKAEERAEEALYEKTYGQYRAYPQPIVKNIDLVLDMYPENRKLQYAASLLLSNPSTIPIDTLHLEWMDFSVMDSFAIKGYTLSLFKRDTVLRHNIYVLDHSLLPGDSIQCNVSGSLQYRGFTNDDPQKELCFNGSFLSRNFIPFFGYDDRRELKENQYRVQHGFSKLASRLPDAADQIAGKQLFASTQAGRMHYTLTVSTSAGQNIVAPGKLQKEWRSGNRHYYRFSSQQSALFDFSVLSAAYAVTKQPVNIAGKTIDVEIYYHPAHYRNVAHFIASAREALTYLNNLLGDYPYSTLCIAERPHYDEELYAYENIIVLPENHGWLADVRKQEDQDYLRYVTTRKIAEQYMRQANISRTQGYPVIKNSIPAYIALQQQQQLYGAASVQKRLEKNYDIYLKGRAKEENAEPLLLQSDEQSAYVSEQKGSYALYKLSRVAGAPAVNNAIRAFLDSAKMATLPVNAGLFYRELQAAVGIEHTIFLRSAFESTDMLKPERDITGGDK